MTSGRRKKSWSRTALRRSLLASCFTRGTESRYAHVADKEGGYVIFGPLYLSWVVRMSLVFGCVISDDLYPPVVRLGGNGISRDIDSQRFSHLGFAIRDICEIARMK